MLLKYPEQDGTKQQGAVEEFQTTGVPLKAVTAPSWALIWTLTKAYFTINWSCRAYSEQAGGAWWKPGAEWLGKLAFFSFQKFNVILLNWCPVSCIMNSQLSRSWLSSVCLSQVSCISLSTCFLLPIRNPLPCSLPTSPLGYGIVVKVKWIFSMVGEFLPAPQRI